ncbi:DUF3311 domain-containing protein [Deinococcus maricopensis]|uniref:DUF3311 domain-containing protein n=1 Tax=Deinococcus maricopensis (strain DSM 21211 / LMG 22137 / NRRL B-23946 / LB-34) TaxID=709986 RepID=E8UB81_DEIML|nr:DUF3311 domain-containing protein [Deinococcus maricopensis]ADV68320.1 hypothetical protein Deima_2689 [Deinococcus maricopensis DSM 21211]
MSQPSSSRHLRHRAWLWLLALPWIALLPVPLYNQDAPRLLGFPFFYWYQLLWVPLASLITWIVYVKTRPLDTTPPATRDLGDAHAAYTDAPGGHA